MSTLESSAKKIKEKIDRTKVLVDVADGAGKTGPKMSSSAKQALCSKEEKIAEHLTHSATGTVGRKVSHCGALLFKWATKKQKQTTPLGSELLRLARTSEAACNDAIQSLFSSDALNGALNEALFKALNGALDKALSVDLFTTQNWVKTNGPSDKAQLTQVEADIASTQVEGKNARYFGARVQLALALRQLVGSNAREAAALLSRLREGEQNNDVLALQCELAKTTTGMEALLNVEGKKSWPAEKQTAYRTALEAAAWLKAESPTLFGKFTSLQNFADDLRVPYRGSVLKNHIGESYDAKHKLACQALAFAFHELNLIGKLGEPPCQQKDSRIPALSLNEKYAVPACRGGYVAWQNGFKRSDKGSDFQQMLAHMWRMRVYVNRTLGHTGDRTALNLAKDLLGSLRTMVLGKKKNPLHSMVSGGHKGSALNLRQQERTRLAQAQLAGSEFEKNGELLNPVKNAKGGFIVTDVKQGKKQVTTNTPEGVKTETVPVYKKLDHAEICSKGAVIPALLAEIENAPVGNNDKWKARVAILNKWSTDKTRTVRYHSSDAAFDGLDSKAIRKELGEGLFSIPTRLRLKTLEKWTVELHGLKNEDRRVPMRQLQEEFKTEKNSNKRQGLDMLCRIGQMRETFNGGRLAAKDRTDLFQLRDLKNILLGRKAREVRKGIDRETIVKVLSEAAEGDEVITSVSGHNIGLNPGGVLNVGIGSASFAGAVANVSVSREAVMFFGDGSHGFECIVGKQKRIRTEFGARMGLTFALGEKRLKIGPYGVVSSVREKAKGSALALLVLQDRGERGDSSKKIAVDLTNFLVNRFALGVDEKGEPLSSSQLIYNKAELWSAFSKEFGDTNRVSVGLRNLSYDSKQINAEVGLAARVAVNNDSLGPVASLTYSSIKKQDTRRDAVAGFGLNRQTMLDEKTWGASATLLSIGGQQLKGLEDTSLDSRSVGFVGVGAQGLFSSQGSSIRLLNEHGRINAGESTRDEIFASVEDLEKHLNTLDDEDRKAWMWRAKDAQQKEIDVGAHCDAVDADAWTGDNPKIAFGKVYGDDAMKKFIANAKALSNKGSCVVTTRWILHPLAADELTMLQDEIRMLNGTAGSEQQILALQARMQTIQTDYKFWRPKWLAVAENFSEGARLSFDYGLQLGAFSAAGSRNKTQRLMFDGEARREFAKDRTANSGAENTGVLGRVQQGLGIAAPAVLKPDWASALTHVS